MAELDKLLKEVADERDRQDAKYGPRTLRDGTGGETLRRWAEQDRAIRLTAFRKGEGTWRHVLADGLSRALAEDDPAKLWAGLLEVAASAVAWVEAIDQRTVDRG